MSTIKRIASMILATGRRNFFAILARILRIPLVCAIVDSFQSALRLWRNQPDSSLPIALLCLLATLFADDLDRAWNFYGERQYRRLAAKRSELRNVKKRAIRKKNQSTSGLDDPIEEGKEIHYRPMLKVYAINPATGQLEVVRALINTASTVSLITPRLAEHLQLTRLLEWPSMITRHGGILPCVQSTTVQVQLESLDQSHRTVPLNLIILNEPTLFENIAQSRQLCQLARRSFGITLIDQANWDEENKMLPFDIMLGQDCLHLDILPSNVFQTLIQADDKLVFFSTYLGWTAMGIFDAFKYRNDTVFRQTKKQALSAQYPPIVEKKSVHYTRLSVDRDFLSWKERLLYVYECFNMAHYALFLALLLLVLTPVFLLYRFIRQVIATRRNGALWHSALNDRLVAYLCAFANLTVEHYYQIIRPYFGRFFFCKWFLGHYIRPYRAADVPFHFPLAISVRLSSCICTVKGPVILSTAVEQSVIDPELADRLHCTRYQKDSAKGTFVRLSISSIDRVYTTEPVEIELRINDSPIHIYSGGHPRTLWSYAIRRFSIVFPNENDCSLKPAKVLLGCDVLATAGVFFPAPYANFEIGFTERSNLWFISTRLGWTFSGASCNRHNWRQRYTHREARCFGSYSTLHQYLIGFRFWEKIRFGFCKWFNSKEVWSVAFLAFDIAFFKWYTRPIHRVKTYIDYYGPAALLDENK